MKKQVILVISVFISFFTATPSQADLLGGNVFTTCGRFYAEDVGRIENGGWYWYDMGNAREEGSGGWVYGGSYVTSNERINKSDYGKGSGYLKTTAYRLKRNDGTWLKKLVFPLTSYDSVCQ